MLLEWTPRAFAWLLSSEAFLILSIDPWSRMLLPLM